LFSYLIVPWVRDICDLVFSQVPLDITHTIANVDNIVAQLKSTRSTVFIPASLALFDVTFLARDPHPRATCVENKAHFLSVRADEYGAEILEITDVVHVHSEPMRFF
jgi:hypothetical protein